MQIHAERNTIIKDRNFTDSYSEFHTRSDHQTVPLDADIPPVAEDLVICTDPPTLEVVKAAIEQVTSNGRRGIRWTLTSILKNPDYTDDIVLLSHQYQDMQAKNNILATSAGSLGVEISTKKTRHLRMNSRSSEATMLNWKTAKEVEQYFTYLCSKVNQRR
ncbi:hypothetical protein ACROYT_G038073 [Oculina patagonica]